MIVVHLAEVLRERRMTTRELCEGTKLSYPTVLGLVRRRSTRMDFHTLDAICLFLGLKVHQVLEYAVGAQPQVVRPGRKPKVEDVHPFGCICYDCLWGDDKLRGAKAADGQATIHHLEPRRMRKTG